MVSPIVQGLSQFADSFANAYVRSNSERQRRKAEAEARKEQYDFQREQQQIQQTFQRDAETRQRIAQREAEERASGRQVEAEQRHRGYQVEDQSVEEARHLAPGFGTQMRGALQRQQQFGGRPRQDLAPGAQGPLQAMPDDVMQGAARVREALAREEHKREMQRAAVGPSISARASALHQANESLGRRYATLEGGPNSFETDPAAQEIRKRFPEAVPMVPNMGSAFSNSADDRRRNIVIQNNLAAVKQSLVAERRKDRPDAAMVAMLEGEQSVLSRVSRGMPVDAEELAQIYALTAHPRRFKAAAKQRAGQPLTPEEQAALTPTPEEMQRYREEAARKIDALR